jgi:hypothetical protein
VILGQTIAGEVKVDYWEQVCSVRLLTIEVAAHVACGEPPQGVARLNVFSLIELAAGVVCAGDTDNCR